jgi:signal transduction histidine kinase
MKSSVYYLNSKLKKGDEKLQKHLGIIQRGIDNSDRIITDVLGFARIRKPELLNTNINTEVRAALTDSQLPAGVKTHIDFDHEIPEVLVDPIQLHQIFVNIITNAVQAMQEQGELRIQTRLNGRYLEVSYADNGPGMDKEIAAQVFDPLFTTKPKGTGLGLAVCKSLIQRQGGGIRVKSRTGHGTTFTVLLPLEQNNGGR